MNGKSMFFALLAGVLALCMCGMALHSVHADNHAWMLLCLAVGGFVGVVTYRATK